MDFNAVSYGDAVPIDGYGPNGFRIGGALHPGPLVLGPSGLAAWGGFEEVGPLLALSGAIDVLLIGTGAEIAPIPAELRTTLEDAGLGVDMMATGPACRTYNVLLGEGRRIGAALLPV